MNIAPLILANAGVPMIAMQLPAMVLTLVPIILLEAGVLGRFFKISWLQAVTPSTVANVVSTFIGIPLAWGAMVGLEMLTAGSTGHGFATPGARFATVVLQAPWLLPYEEQLDWLIPAANLVLLPTYFAASVVVERWVIQRFRRSEDSRRVTRAVLFSNAVSYLLLLLASVAWLLARLPGSLPAA